MQKASDIYMEQFARLGVISKVQQLASAAADATTPTAEQSPEEQASQSNGRLSMQSVNLYIICAYNGLT